MLNMTVQYRGPDGMSQQLWDEVRAKYGGRAQNKGFVTGWMADARAGQTGGHFADAYGVTHAVDIGVDIESDGSGLLPKDALALAEHLRKLGAAGKHPFSKRGYLIHDLSTTTTPTPRIAGFHTGWKWQAYTGASPHSDHIHVTTGGDQQWGGAPQLAPVVYNSKQSWGVAKAAAATPGGGNTVSGAMRVVPEMYGITQTFYANATIYNYGAGHGAIDYGTPQGTPVVAPEDGVVEHADWVWNLPDGWEARDYQIKPARGDTRTGGGIAVRLRNSIGSRWWHCHLSRTDLNTGDRVRKGQIIGYTGNTGSSTGPHLHLSLLPPQANWSNGYFGAIDPAPFIKMKYAPITSTAWQGSATTGKGSASTKFDLLEWLAMASQAEINKALTAWANSAGGKAAIGTAVLDRKFKDSQNRNISLAYVLKYDKANWDIVRAIAQAVKPSSIAAALTLKK